MKIEKITQSTIHYVKTDDEEYNEYTRHSADNWTVIMGESEETVHDCTELERLFQESIINFLTTGSIHKNVEI